MTETEKKALALLNEACRGRTTILYNADTSREYSVEMEALCRAIEQHEAFKREVSDALVEVRDTTTYEVHPKLWRFILPKPDPLVEAWLEAFPGNHIDDAREECAKISASLAARGLEIREVRP